LIDAHCHLDFKEFDSDRGALLENAERVGVRGFIVAGVDPKGWDRQARLELDYPKIKVAYGLHPWAVARMDDAAVDRSLELLEARLGFALGETGLDRSRHCAKESYERQARAFRAQLSLAIERNIPIILHIVAAHGLALDILHEVGVPAAGGLVHSYSGSAELVSNYEDLGLHLSFSAAICNLKSRKVREAVRMVSRERLLVETDCPDQVSAYRNAERNLPEWLTDVVREVSSIRQESFEDVAEYTAQNTARLFDLEDWL